MDNLAILKGRLTRKPEYGKTQNGKSYARFTLAVETKFKDSKETDFIPVIAYGTLGDFCYDQLDQGQKAMVIGKLHIRKYDKDGEQRTWTEVTADDVEFLQKAKGNSDATSDEPFDGPF